MECFIASGRCGGGADQTPSKGKGHGTRLVINRAETRKRLGEGRRKHLQDVDVNNKDPSKLCILSYVIFLIHSNSDM